MVGIAIGFITSLPVDDDHITGSKATMVVVVVIKRAFLLLVATLPKAG